MVLIPREFEFDVDEIEIFRCGDEIILRKPIANLAEAFDILTSLPDDFFQDGRDDPPPWSRESWD